MKNVLIVEPNRVMAETYATSLEVAGIKGRLANGAQEAIDKADAQTPDLVLLELQLADHSGLEFLHEFRSYTEWRHIPVIVNTNIPSQRVSQNKQYLEQVGIQKVLYKPAASLRQIIREIQSLL